MMFVWAAFTVLVLFFVLSVRSLLLYRTRRSKILLVPPVLLFLVCFAALLYLLAAWLLVSSIK